MIEKVKLTLRLSSSDFDDEIRDLIESAKIDLGIANIDYLAESDPMIGRAITLYCLLNFGQPDEYDRLKKAYDELKSQLGMSGRYTTYAE